jgi:hypothetical protein
LVAEFIGIFTDKRKIRAAMHVFLARRDWCWQPDQGAALYTRPVHRGPGVAALLFAHSIGHEQGPAAQAEPAF